MSKGDKLAKNTFILSLCTLINKGLLFVMLPFFTRWLSVEEYGLFDVFSTYVALLIPIISLSSSNAIFRLAVDADDDNKKNYITNGLIINLFNLLIIILLLLLLKCFVKIHYFSAFICLLISEIIDNYFQGYLRALKKLQLYGICRTSTVVFTAISVTVLVIGFNTGLNGLIIGYAVGYFISSILIVFATKFWQYIDIKRVSSKYIKKLISYSWALIPNDISWWIINVSDRQIISSFLGTMANGIYAVSCKIPSLCSSVFGVFNISWQESAIDTLNENDRKSYYNGVFDTVLTILLSICIGILSLNFVFFDYIFDSRYTLARLYSPILVASVVFSTMSLFYGGIQISLKRPKQNGFSTIIGAILNLVIHLVLINYIGLYAAAISTLLSNLAVVAIRAFQLKKDFYFRLNAKHIILVLIFVYFAFVATKKLHLAFEILNVLFALLVFLYANWIYLKKFLNVAKRII